MNLYVAGGVLLVLIGTHIGAFMLGHERATDKCALEQAAADARWQDWYVHAAEEANKRAAQFEKDKKRVDSSLETLRREIAAAPAADCRLSESDVLLWNRILCAGAAPVPANLMVRPDPPVLLRSTQWKDVLDNLMLNTAIAAKLRIQLDGLIDYLERLNADLAVQRAEQHDDPERFELGELDIALNVELDDRGQLRRRTGIRRLSTGSTHSLFSTGDHLLGVRAQALSVFDPSGWSVLRNLATDEPMSFAHLFGRTFFCNGVDMGVLDNLVYRELGVPVPAQQPVAVPTAGSLPPGRYQYAVTFQIGGQEGGTNNAGVIELTSSGGIDFSQIAEAPAGATKSLYVSAANGEAMYRVAEMSAGESTFRLQSDDFRGRQLRTQFCSPPPVGNIVRVWNGVTYIVVGDAVFYSRPFEYELFDLAHRFLQFGEPVTMFEPLHSGIYVGTPTRVHWMAGEAPERFQLNESSASGAIPGTAAQISASDLLKGSDDRHGQNSRPALIWTSQSGIFSGYDGGQVLNITERAYRVPESIRGAAFVRNESGFSQYLTSLQGVVQPINV